MHVVFLTQTMNVHSGWGRYAFETVTRVRKRGMTTTALVEEPSGDDQEHVLLAGAVSSLPRALKSVTAVRSFIKKADVIHALDAYPYGLIAALANVGINKPLIMSAVATYAIYPLVNRKLRPLMKWAYRRADIITPITNYTGEKIRELVTALPTLERVMLGVDANDFCIVEKPTNNEDKPYLLSVGALKKRKGYHFVIPALAELKKDFPSLKYIIVGDNSDQSYVSFLQELMIKYGVAGMVEIRGSVKENELRALYADCEAFVLIPENSRTNFAGFHLVFLEANALGKPVISGQGFGAEEVIENGGNGFLVPPGDTVALVKCLRSLLADESLQRQMRLNSRSFAVNHDWEKTVTDYLSLYHKICKTDKVLCS